MIQRLNLAALVLLALIAAFLATWNAAPVFAECPDRYNKCVDGPELTIYPVVEFNENRTTCVSVVRADGFKDPVFTETGIRVVRVVWEGLLGYHRNSIVGVNFSSDKFKKARPLGGGYYTYYFVNFSSDKRLPDGDGYHTFYFDITDGVMDWSNGYVVSQAIAYWLGFGDPIPRLSYIAEYRNHWDEYERLQGWATLVDPHKFLAHEQMVKDCKRLLVETQRTMDQDRLHQTNLAIAQAKIDGARALEEYYLSQLEPMRQQIAELEAIQSVVLDALAAMRVQLDALYDLRVRYAEDMAKYAAQIRDETGKMAEAMSNALARVDLAALKTEGAVADIQADIDRIESDKAQVQALIQQAQDEIEKAREELNRLETGVESPNN